MSSQGINSTRDSECPCTVRLRILSIIRFGATSSIAASTPTHPECKNLWHRRQRWQAITRFSYIPSFPVQEIQCQCHHCATSNLWPTSAPNCSQPRMETHPTCRPWLWQTWQDRYLAWCWNVCGDNTPWLTVWNLQLAPCPGNWFGWVLAGSAGNLVNPSTVAFYHVSTLTGDDILHQFWKSEEKTVANSTLTLEERSVLDHFNSEHSHTPEGRFIIPLPKHSSIINLGESWALAVRRFLSFEYFLHEVEEVMEEYFNHHAKEVPLANLERPREEVLPADAYSPQGVKHDNQDSCSLWCFG